MRKDKNLVIVESPTKAKTISKILGDNFSVVSSMGHLIDLPKKELGVDIQKSFQPSYVVIPGRQKVLSALKKASKGKDNIYVATDPDREGEAIGWHIKEQFFKKRKVVRVIFHEITSGAIKDSFKNPRDFNLNMVEAQIGRRILDRIVGYFLSPLLWKKLARGLSAGRVQSVALRLIIERERQIKDFIPQEYWEIEAELKKKKQDDKFIARLEKIEDKKVEIKNEKEADKIIDGIKGKDFVVSDIKEKEKRRFPAPPFITSTLQQEAFNKLRFNARRTMLIAQQLYEGVDIGEDAPVGLITYMRTDSTKVAAVAIKEVRDLILKKYSRDYLPQAPNVYKVKKFAQEAHEAIRPTLISRSVESLNKFLTPEQYKLYELIYNRFLSSQMTPARYLVTTVSIRAGKYLFLASGTIPIFDGFTVVYNKDNQEKEEEKNKIPPLEKDELLDLLRVIPSQHFTKPPPRFSDSSLVKSLEENGIGRPSTYAPIIYTLIQRDYARRLKGYFYPTELGFKVCDLLVEYFPRIMDIKFTADMEEELDQIEEGVLNRLKVLQDFYNPFKENLDFAQANIKKEIIQTKEVCDQCGRPMVIKWGRKGKFLSCSGFPQCKSSKSITTGVKCPEANCGGELIERRSRRGFFFGCSNYPKCRFTSRDLPETKA
ncbi:MAG: type I DNA topoisomerase [Candidatus Omnitrophica bacterium]|nr:type I DNA topoisomerase [Candidatus Omnitrophota bacterium]MBU4473504.1 type I DNA topoisomerase [Candidatus Omnitrophota bacterium]MCG2706840.1 type I DNA topoisomerase [Candidatus Omnitrophota bacterium]